MEALASLASCYAAVYAESMAVVGTETALTSFLSSQWEQMSSIGISNRVQSSLFAAVDTKIEAQAMFAQSAYTAISSMRQEQKKLLGLANLTSTNLILQSSSEKVTLTTMAKATFILRQWKRQEGLKTTEKVNEEIIAAALEAEMKSERAIELAVIAQATLIAILRMSRVQVEALGILASMKETLLKLYPIFKGVSPQIAGAVTKPALQVALDILYQNPTTPKPNLKSTTTYPVELRPGPPPWPTAREDNGPYLNRLFSSLDGSTLNRPLFGGPSALPSDDDATGSLPTANWASAGSSIVNQRKVQSLPLLIPTGHHPGSVVPSSNSNSNAGAPPLDGIAERAMLAEAALAATLKVPVARFDAGFWTTVAGVVREIAPVVARAAPSVYAGVGSVVRGLKGPCPCCQVQLAQMAAAVGAIGEPWSPSFESGYLPAVGL